MKSQNHFASDNYSGVHPEVLLALANANEGHVTAYGDDEYTASAQEKFRKLFGDVEVHFVFNGTAANVLSLGSILKSHESVICSEKAHINEDECGAPEYMLGCKLVALPSRDGKIYPENISARLCVSGDQHRAQTKVISITQSTEYGTVYSLDEIKAISQLARSQGLLLHMDGARIANSAVSMKHGHSYSSGSTLSLKLISTYLKGLSKYVDVLSFGGTKNGMMYGEAVVFFNRDLAQNFLFRRKHSMQLASKMRFISAQFEALLTDHLWLKNARHSNSMAQLLARELRSINVEITQDVDANGVFAVLPKNAAAAMQKHFKFYVWDERASVKGKAPSTCEVRLMCSFDTTEKDIAEFVQKLVKLL